MKEIKIRAWDEDYKRMHYYPIIEKDEVFDEYLYNDPLLCIGEKDKNGKEIWEEDIIKFKGKKWDNDGQYSEPTRIEVVKFENGQFFAPHMYEEDCYEIEWNEVEIIGNTFENPEILEEKK